MNTFNFLVILVRKCIVSVLVFSDSLLHESFFFSFPDHVNTLKAATLKKILNVLTQLPHHHHLPVLCAVFFFFLYFLPSPVFHSNPIVRTLLSVMHLGNEAL